MTSMELLEALGKVKDSYVLDAHEEHSPQRKGLSLKRPLLIAAIVALMLVLVGCTVAVLLGLKDLQLAQGSHTDRRTGQTEVWDIVSLQGFVGSDDYLAAKEWYEFKQAHDTTYDGSDIPEDYEGYGLISKSGREKIDEICEKYGLKLLGKLLDEGDTLDMLGIGSIWKEGAEMEAEITYDGYYFSCGTFQMEGKLTLTGEDAPWGYPVNFQIRCARKGYFDGVYLNVGDITSYDQWAYEHPDGQLLLAVSKNQALMLVDKEDFFVTVNITNPTVENGLLGKVSMDRNALQAVADVFDFSFRPREVTEEALLAAEESHAEHFAQEQEKRQAQYDKAVGKASYAARVKYYLENAEDPEQMGFAFYDIDGNGVEELLIGKDGYCVNIYTEAGGTTEEYLDPTTYEYCYPCEGNVVVSVIHITTEDYYINRVTDFQKELVEHIQYHPTAEDGKWRRYTDWRSYELISEEECNEILGSCVRIPVEMLPLTEYPLEEEVVRSENNSSDLWNEDTDYEDRVRQYLTHSEERWYRWSYDLYDIDGNGQEELLWREDDRETIYTMRGGDMKFILGGHDITVCRDGIVKTVDSYGPENKTYRFYRLNGEKLVLVDYLRYDADLEHPWLRSTDVSGQDVSLAEISEAEFSGILGGYVPEELEMKNIGEFPLGE